MLIVAKIWKAIHDELKMVRIIKCRSCGRRLFDVSVIGKRVVSETQCIKDEIFAYRAESARQNCGVLGIVTSIW